MARAFVQGIRQGHPFWEQVISRGVALPRLGAKSCLTQASPGRGDPHLISPASSVLSQGCPRRTGFASSTGSTIPPMCYAFPRKPSRRTNWWWTTTSPSREGCWSLRYALFCASFIRAFPCSSPSAGVQAFFVRVLKAWTGAGWGAPCPSVTPNPHGRLDRMEAENV